MRRPRSLILLLLAVPALASGVSWGVQMKVSGLAREDWERDVAELKQRFRERGALEGDSWPDPCRYLCELSIGQSHPGAGEVLEYWDEDRIQYGHQYLVARLSWYVAIATGILGLLAVSAMECARQVTRRNPHLLHGLFRPGLRLTFAVYSALVAAHALLVASSIYLLDTVFVELDASLPWTVITGAAGAVAMVSAAFCLVRHPKMTVTGTLLTPVEQPELWSEVRRLADRMGAFSPEAIVADLRGCVRMTEEEIDCLNGRMRGRVLHVPVLFARDLPIGELRALIARELARFPREDPDTRSVGFWTVRRGVARAIDGLMRAGWFHRMLVAPALTFLDRYLNACSPAGCALAREWETAADAAAAEVVGARTVGLAGLRVEAAKESGLCNADPGNPRVPMEGRLAALGLLEDELLAEAARTPGPGREDELIRHPDRVEEPLRSLDRYLVRVPPTVWRAMGESRQAA